MKALSSPRRHGPCRLPLLLLTAPALYGGCPVTDPAVRRVYEQIPLPADTSPAPLELYLVREGTSPGRGRITEIHLVEDGRLWRVNCNADPSLPRYSVSYWREGQPVRTVTGFRVIEQHVGLPWTFLPPGYATGHRRQADP